MVRPQQFSKRFGLTRGKSFAMPPFQRRGKDSKLKGSMAFLRRNLLGERDWFLSLKTLPGTASVRKFDFNGMHFAIKQTYGDTAHGANYLQFRRDALAYQFAAKKGRIQNKHHVLRSIKVHGRIGNYLVMSRVQSINRKNLAFPVQRSIEVALDELDRNFRDLTSDGIKLGNSTVHYFPQFHDIMLIGNTNPKKPLKGKWIFCFPYDYF